MIVEIQREAQKYVSHFDAGVKTRITMECVAFAVLPDERNFLTTQSLEDHKLYFYTQVVSMVFTVGEEKCY